MPGFYPDGRGEFAVQSGLDDVDLKACQETTVAGLRQHLLPLADLITPNLHAAEMLTGLKIAEPEDLPSAARR